MKIKEAKQLVVDRPMTQIGGKVQMNFVRSFYVTHTGMYGVSLYRFGMEKNGQFLFDLHKENKNKEWHLLRSVDMSFIDILKEWEDDCNKDIIERLMKTINEIFDVRLFNSLLACVMFEINQTEGIDDCEVTDELINEVCDIFSANLEMICYSRVGHILDDIHDTKKMLMIRTIFYRVTNSFMPKFTSVISTFFAQSIH